MAPTVFYHPGVVPVELPSGAPLGKFADIDRDWRERFPWLERKPSVPATVELLAKVHDREHVEGVLAGRLRNGMGTRDAAHAASATLDVGAFVAAARTAVATGTPSVSIGGGFHHAGYARSHAFCTFNGLMAAAVDLIGSGTVGKAAILDLDNHFGDGTQDIRTRLGLESLVPHYAYAHEMLVPADADGWLSRLPDIIVSLAEGAGILLFNAGVDSHEDDPMTRGVLTTMQMRTREDIVFSTCARLGVPVAWTLAGGYNRSPRKLVELHGFAMEAALRHARQAFA
jgi:Deacetylases, including yeast histone deacetylase and acetoin utilization protein